MKVLRKTILKSISFETFCKYIEIHYIEKECVVSLYFINHDKGSAWYQKHNDIYLYID